MVQELVWHIEHDKPDAVILAGDLAHGLEQFAACLAMFSDFEVPVGVVGGNHDIWKDKEAGHSSTELWEKLLPQAVADAGAVWLEDESLRIGDVAIVGSMAWYDYSAIDPKFAVPEKALIKFKKRVWADSRWIDWRRTDKEFAAELGAGLMERLAEAGADDSIRDILLVTHLPLLEEQIRRTRYNMAWGVTNAFFGNLTLGKEVLQVEKLHTIVSGHTHVGRQATVSRNGAASVEAYVVPSDYGKSAHIIIEV